MKSLFPVGLAVAFFSTDQLWAQDLIGAEKVIEKISAQPGNKGQAAPDSLPALRSDLDEYQATRTTLAPEASAEKWLALTNRLLRLGDSSYRGRGNSADRVTFQDLVAVLPPAGSWPYLEKALNSQKAKGAADEVSLLALRWFVHTLTGDVEARKKDYQLLVEKFTTLSEKEPYLSSILDGLTEQMVASSDDADFIIQLLGEQLQRAITIHDKQKSFFHQSPAQSFSLPDLVTIIGEEKAEAFIKKALTTYPGPISVSSGKRTLALAQRIAEENADSLAAAQWGLTESFDVQNLYASMLKRFGPSKENYDFFSAQSFELGRLILAGKQEEAQKLQAALPKESLNNLPSELLPYAKKVGKTDLVVQFLDTSLRADPALPYWSDFFAASNLDNQPDKAITLMKEALARKGLDAKTTTSLRMELSRALLASGQIDEGVAELAKLSKEALSENSDDSSSYDRGGLDIARIGHLLNRPEWTQEGLALAFQQWEAFQKKTTDTYSSSSVLRFADSLATTLVKIGQPSKAEEVLTKALGWQERNYAVNPPMYPSRNVNSALAGLIGIYTDADRSADVVTLLDRAPWWIATDLSQIQGESVPRANLQNDYLADATAWALNAIGKKDAALQITEARLSIAPGDDRAYEQLLRSAGAGALPILDRLAKQNRFEERPLIWKAQILLTEGKLPEAEETIRAAIAIDPSDGEQGPGDRMRAYAVLADIREARGDAKEAEFFRGVVKAIRLSEQADQFYHLGLIDHALKMYESSLAIFADAYCIQSRLALRMNEQGRWKEAEEHYRKAYELMPESFGRVESHCFGCERAFDGEKAQGVAEKVFTRLAEEKPDSPQVHYLLGYLREEQGRPEEAMKAFQRATTLDPDYLNAWKKIADLSDQLPLTTDERNSIALNIARLDPFSRQSSLDLTGVTDLAAVWTILSERDKLFKPMPKDLYPLKAAQKSIEAMKDDPARKQYYEQIRSSIALEGDRSKPPTTNFTKAPFVSATAQILDAAYALRAR